MKLYYHWSFYLAYYYYFLLLLLISIWPHYPSKEEWRVCGRAGAGSECGLGSFYSLDLLGTFDSPECSLPLETCLSLGLNGTTCSSSYLIHHLSVSFAGSFPPFLRLHMGLCQYSLLGSQLSFIMTEMSP